MQRDVKVGLVLGVLLVAVVAVVFFRRDDNDRDKFTKLLPAPDAVAGRARDMLGPSQSDPYPVADVYLPDSWQTPKSKSTRTPQRNKNGELVAQIDPVENSATARTRKDGSVSAVLQPPEFDAARPGARSKSETLGTRTRSSRADGSVPTGSGTEYTIQEGDTLSDIARKHLGSAKLYQQIYDENRDVLTDSAHIPVGKKIRIPSTARQDRTTVDRNPSPGPLASSTAVPSRSVRDSSYGEVPKSSQAPASSYVVKEGDTLIQIARKHYGQESMYFEILRANEDQIETPAGIHPGMVLRLP